MKEKVHELLEGEDGGAKRLLDGLILLLILLNAVVFALETIKPIHGAMEDFFFVLEMFSVFVFSLEYFLRVWSCTLFEEYKHPLFGRLRFMVTPMALVDLLAILPFYLQFTSVDFLFLRSARLFRIFRLLKLTRYSSALRLIGRVLADKKSELVSTVVIVFMLIFFGSSILYYCERDAQPAAFSSIPGTMWWAVGKLTSGGYGNVNPVTPFGKLTGYMMGLLYLTAFALPTSILGAGFMEHIQNEKNPATAECPHCGKEIPKSK
ncbi:MAG: ion transporter [Nitrospinae bacterium]|nr:ion transporter [Nitrospinota bacterium]